MSKCRVIDRLAYTKGEIRFVGDNDAPKPESSKAPEAVQHGDICPKCGQHTLHFMEGCETCVACGWSACGIDR